MVLVKSNNINLELTHDEEEHKREKCMLLMLDDPNC